MFHTELHSKDYLSVDEINLILFNLECSIDEMTKRDKIKAQKFIDYFTAKSPESDKTASIIDKSTYEKGHAV